MVPISEEPLTICQRFYCTKKLDRELAEPFLSSVEKTKRFEMSVRQERLSVIKRSLFHAREVRSLWGFGSATNARCAVGSSSVLERTQRGWDR